MPRPTRDFIAHARPVPVRKLAHFAAAALALSLLSLGSGLRAEGSAALRGDPAAIADARAMVEAMGGIAIWRDIESVHFVHEWDFASRADRYLEHEILDLTASRSYVTMESEIYQRIRAYSPEHRYWNIVNGEFSYASDERLARSMERAPYNIYRLARAIARGEDRFEVRFGEMASFPVHPALEFAEPDGRALGWILLNVRKEPVAWATTEYTYVFGPLKRFGNLWVPDWATTNDGLVRYQMVSLTGSRQKPDLSLFAPPPGAAERD